MKSITCQCVFFVVSLTFVMAASPALAQSGQVKQQPAATDKETPALAGPQVGKKPNDSTVRDEKGLSEEQLQGLRRQRASEGDAADVSYLRNYFDEYRLGPEDIVSVDVFKQPDYSLQNQIVPPDGKINYKLIGPVVLRGRTTEDVQKEIAEKLSEYIIDPKVTVQLIQSHSMKYIIDGDVGRPGIFEMTRRMTVREAVVNSGGILPTGDRAQVKIARALPTGGTTTIAINFKELDKGKGIDEFLAPGDVIFVPGNRFKTISKYLQIVQTVTYLPTILGRRF